MRSRLSVLIALMTILIGSSLSSAAMTTAAGSGRMRIVHAVADVTAIDVYLNGKRLLMGLNYKENTAFFELASQTYDVAIRPANADANSQPLVTKKVDVPASGWINVVAEGLAMGKDTTAADIGVYPTDHSATKGRARLELINAIPGALAYDWVSGGRTTFSGSSQGKGSLSVDLPQGIYDFNVVASGTKEPILRKIQGFQVVSDIIYTNVMLGTPDKIDIIHMSAGNLLIRAVNASPDTPPVDVYINGKKTFNNLAYKGTSDLAELEARSYEVTLRPAGAASDSRPIYRQRIQLPAGVAATYVISGLLGGKEKQALRIRLSYAPPIFDGLARIGLLHESPDGPAIQFLIGGKQATSGLVYGEGYGRFVQPGAYDVAVLPAGKTMPALIDLRGVKVGADDYYLVLMANTKDRIEPIVVTTKSYAVLKGAMLSDLFVHSKS